MNSVYALMSTPELERECKRLETMQHLYADRGLVVMAHSYAVKLVTAVLTLANR